MNSAWWANNVGNKRFCERVQAPATVGGRVQYQPSNRTLTDLVVSVQAGGVDIWLGLVDGQGIPDLHFGTVNHPVWVPLPPGVTSLTLIGIGPATPSAAILVGGY